MGRTKIETKIYSKMETIEFANEHVSIVDVLSHCGIVVPDDIPVGGSYKTHCPFDFQHPDGGATAALRVYSGTNNCYCFAESLSMPPVRLWSLHRGIAQFAAATDLLSSRGMEVGHTGNAVDTSLHVEYLAAALSLWCARTIPEWETNQLFNQPVADAFLRCKAVARKVETEGDVERWLAASKSLMKTAATQEGLL